MRFPGVGTGLRTPRSALRTEEGLMALALEHIRVLDLGFAVNTPYASTILADYGADVIKVEQVGGEAGRATLSWAGAPQKLSADRSVLFEHTNTNKRSLPLDLKHP